MRLYLPVLLMLSACGGASSATISADSATATAGETVRVRVIVTTPQGGVRMGAKVSFSAPAPAQLSTTSAETNAQGVAETRVTLNEAGKVVVTASVDDTDYTATITFKAAPPAPIVATRLRFENQPANVTGQNLLRDANSQPLRVVLTDEAGALATDASGSVKVALTGGSCSATIDPLVSHYTSATVSNGGVEFGQIRFTATGTGCTLTATSSGLTAAVSGTFNVQ